MTLQNNTIIYNLRAIQTSSEHAYKKKTKSRVGKLIKSPTVGNIYGVLDIWLHGNYHGMHTLEYLKEREREFGLILHTQCLSKSLGKGRGVFKAINRISVF